MATGYAFVANDNVVVRKSSHAIETEVEWVNVADVFDVKGESPGGSSNWSVGRDGNGGGVEILVVGQHPEIAGKRLISTCSLNGLPCGAEQVPPRLAFEVQTVEPRI